MKKKHFNSKVLERKEYNLEFIFEILNLVELLHWPMNKHKVKVRYFLFSPLYIGRYYIPDKLPLSEVKSTESFISLDKACHGAESRRVHVFGLSTCFHIPSFFRKDKSF